jgi:molybdopterin biosynthesis enzyme
VRRAKACARRCLWSNTAIIAAAVLKPAENRSRSGVPGQRGRARCGAAARALATSDIVLLSGGVGGGDRVSDRVAHRALLVPRALKPGKPLCLAVEEQQQTVRQADSVLPGFRPPRSSFHAFIAPLIRARAGHRRKLRKAWMRTFRFVSSNSAARNLLLVADRDVA